MYKTNFDFVVEKAKAVGKKIRVVIAGADAENILLGAFRAEADGFAKLILVGDTVYAKHNRLPEAKVRRDTAEFVFMQEDSLVLRFPHKTISFHRQASIMEANKEASAAAAKQAAQDSVR